MDKTVVQENLEQVLRDDVAETVPPASEAEPQTEETVVSTRDDDAPTQGDAKDFSVALNKRMERERQKLEAEFAAKHQAELEFARSMRVMRGDKEYSDILKEVFEGNVREFAQENGVPEGIARELLILKMNNPPAPAPEQPQNSDQNPRIGVLADQVEEIRDGDGVDMMEVLRDNPTLREKVGSGEWDINRAYAAYLSSERKRTPPVAKGSTVSPAAISFANLSKEQFDAYEARLARGEKIPL